MLVLLMSLLLALVPSPVATGGVNETGVNDWACRPSAAHPVPVVLVHGTRDNAEHTWRALGPALVARGYCAYALTYGVPQGPPASGTTEGGLAPVATSAGELRDFVGRVLAATGEPRVDIVGYSQGTVVPTYWAKLLGGADKINNYVSLAPLWDGTNLAGLGNLVSLLHLVGLGGATPLLTDCAACPDLLTGSAMLRRLHEGGIFLPGITYTNIVTRYDHNVVPYTSGLGEGPNVTNVVLQDGCPADEVDHIGIVVDPNAMGHVFNALDPARAAPVRCVPTGPDGPRAAPAR
jgi:triacylglycerol esterase/lipase EstA (alpha/beta hydrolase family)